MFDLSWGEMLLIGAVALIVIGPKDLPRTLRAVGQAVGKVRRMASEFQGQFNQAMREAELDQVRKDVEGMSRAAQAGLNPAKAARDELKRAVEGKVGLDKGSAAKAGAAGAAATSAPDLSKASPAEASAGETPAGETSPAAAPALATVDPGAVAADAPPAPVLQKTRPEPAAVDTPASLEPEPATGEPRGAKP